MPGGRPPKPTRLKELHGTYRRDRAPKNEAQPEARRPTCPRWLSGDARKAWRRLAPRLYAAGLLTQVDQNALSRYCQLWARWRASEAHILEHGAVCKMPSGYSAQNPHVGISTKLAALLSRLESDFGMSPSARTKISVAPALEQPTELDQLIERSRRSRANPVARIGTDDDGKLA